MSKALPAGLVDLATRGLVTIGAPNDPAVYPTLPLVLPSGRLTQLLNVERDNRMSIPLG